MNYFMERGREAVRNAPELFIDFDVEADGVAGRGSLLSIGAVDPWGDTFYRELRPNDANGFMDDYREITDMNGLEHDRLMEEGIDAVEALSDLAEWAKQRREAHEKVGGIALVGYNASYDFPLVNLEYVRAGIESPFGHAAYCIKSLAMALPRNQYSWKRTGKGSLPSIVVPEGEFSHNGLEDAVYQQQIHHGLVGVLLGPDLG